MSWSIMVKEQECHCLLFPQSKEAFSGYLCVFIIKPLLCNINLATVLLQVFTSSRSWCSALLSLLRHCRRRPASPPRLDVAGAALDRTPLLCPTHTPMPPLRESTPPAGSESTPPLRPPSLPLLLCFAGDERTHQVCTPLLFPCCCVKASTRTLT